MRILIAERPHNPDTPIILNKAGHDVFVPKETIVNVHEFGRTELIQTIKDLKVDVLVVGFKFQINKEILNLGIKVVATRTTNITDHIDYKYCEEKGIEIINLKGEELIDVTTVAEACLGAMIQLSRLDTPGQEIRGKTLGLWGYGRIAHHFEKYALAHDMRVIKYDIKLKETENQSHAGLLDVLLECSDYISLHASSTSENKGIVRYEHFK